MPLNPNVVLVYPYLRGVPKQPKAKVHIYRCPERLVRVKGKLTTKFVDEFEIPRFETPRTVTFVIDGEEFTF